MALEGIGNSEVSPRAEIMNAFREQRNVLLQSIQQKAVEALRSVANSALLEKSKDVLGRVSQMGPWGDYFMMAEGVRGKNIFNKKIDNGEQILNGIIGMWGAVAWGLMYVAYQENDPDLRDTAIGAYVAQQGTFLLTLGRENLADVLLAGSQMARKRNLKGVAESLEKVSVTLREAPEYVANLIDAMSA